MWYAEHCEDQDWKRLAEAWKNTGIRQKLEEWARKQKILLQGPVVAEIFVEWVDQGSSDDGGSQMTAAWLETLCQATCQSKTRDLIPIRRTSDLGSPA